MDVNRGYAGGYNTALDELKLTHPELVYAVLMNSDIEPQSDWLPPHGRIYGSPPEGGSHSAKVA